MVPVQMRKMSSIYRASVRGLTFCVRRKAFIVVDIKILAMVGEKAAPMAVPLICWKMWSAKAK